MEQMYFLEIAEKHKDMIYRIALNYFRNTYDADDTVQDVLLKLYEYKKPFDNDEHIKHWLIRVTINVCKDRLKMPWRRRNVAMDELTDAITFDKTEQSELFLLIMSLPQTSRTVLYLFYYEDLSVKDIANLLKIRESAVTTRLSRARNQLKTILTEV